MVNKFKKERGPLSRPPAPEWRIKAQTTIFIILAIIIVIALVVYFVFRGNLLESNVPSEIKPIYNSYLDCVERETQLGSLIIGEQAGYIESPEFEAGSVYMPFSNQLDFFGIGVPYWHYVSGNGVVREQIPSKEKIEEELGRFVGYRINFCDFSEFVERGFEIEIEPSEGVRAKIEDREIEVRVEQNLKIRYGDSVWTGNKHTRNVDSNLGNFYNLAKKIYEHWKETMFLENYGVDMLRLYAPVDGSELGCSSMVWGVAEVRENLTRALEANVPFTKVKGDYYDLKNEENKYFVQDIGEDVDASVNFVYLREWPMKMEVWPSENGLLKADPVGLQEGLGMLGFCYVPYHFVYDFAYPVLIQMYYEEEMFQFPLVVYINKNQPREPIDGESLPNVVSELCEHKTGIMKVSTYDFDQKPIEADISFKCFDTSCDIGRSRISGDSAHLIESVPQCVNGYVVASANGYEAARYMVTSLEEQEVSVFLKKEYELDLEIRKDGSLVDDYAVVSFEKDGRTKTLSYPEQKRITLAEGDYEIKVYVYSDSSLRVGGGSTEKCITVPKSGFLGVFGLTEERCLDIDIPDQQIEFAVSGGGTQKHYILESELRDFDKIVIDADGFDGVSAVEDLQENYNRIETSRLNVRFE